MTYESNDALLTVSYNGGDAIGRYHNFCQAIEDAGLHVDGKVYGHRDLGLYGNTEQWREEVLPEESKNACQWFTCTVDEFGQKIIRHHRERP